MATKKKNTQSAVSRFKVRDIFPSKEFSKFDKLRIATQIANQLNPTTKK